MAVATLERCYNNYGVFQGVVKIRKGEAVKMMMDATSTDRVKSIFNHFVHQVQYLLVLETTVFFLSYPHVSQILSVDEYLIQIYVFSNFKVILSLCIKQITG